jgi:tryptophanyl-tRNA synthetase
MINQVSVDNEYVGNKQQYTFYNIADFHSITASFKPPIQYENSQRLYIVAAFPLYYRSNYRPGKRY